MKRIPYIPSLNSSASRRIILSRNSPAGLLVTAESSLSGFCTVICCYPIIITNDYLIYLVDI